VKKVVLILMVGLGQIIFAQEAPLNDPERIGSGPTGYSSRQLANEETLDPQVMMSLAWAAYEQGDLGRALQYAQRTSRALTQHADSQYLIGLVYLKDGLHTLAERALKNAMLYAYTDEERADYAMALATLYYRINEFQAMQIHLEDVVLGFPLSDEAVALRTTTKEQISRARQILLNEGLERVAQLYRWQGLHHDSAVEVLALHAYSQDTYVGYGKAVEYFTYSAVVKIGVLIEHLIAYDPGYRFESLQELLNRAGEYRQAQIYMEKTELYRTLFLLAASLYAYEKSDVSKIIWNGLRLQQSNSIWVRRSALRFREPLIENFSAEFDQLVRTLS
jgi:tetratricopeptide (TPR) repeat protein